MMGRGFTAAKLSYRSNGFFDKVEVVLKKKVLSEVQKSFALRRLKMITAH
jgi:hypothetical protein